MLNFAAWAIAAKTMNPLQNISADEVLSRLRFENPWWETGELSPYWGRIIPRKFTDSFFREIDSIQMLNRAIVLMGPRRAGKTVMLHHTLGWLMGQGVAPSKMMYAAVDVPIYTGLTLEKLFAYGRSATGETNPAGWWVMFDEIQYLNGWESQLKVLVDSYPQTRFVVSGSAAAALQFGSMESGAGRFRDFRLPLLTFYEYLELSGRRNLMRAEQQGPNPIFKYSSIAALNTAFLDYINFGGFPELAAAGLNSPAMQAPLKKDILDKVLLRDLPSLYGVADIRELYKLFNYLAFNSGAEASLENISQSWGIDKRQLSKYLEYLEAAYLIKRVYPVGRTPRKPQRVRQFKVYLTHPTLRALLFSPLANLNSDEEMGPIIETAVAAQFMFGESFTPYYARWEGGEIDFIQVAPQDFSVQEAMEIKWSNTAWRKGDKRRTIVKFCQVNGLQHAILTSASVLNLSTVTQDSIQSDDRPVPQISVIPVAVLCYLLSYFWITTGPEKLVEKVRTARIAAQNPSLST